MDADESKFLKSLLRTVVNSAIYASLRRMPLAWTIGIGVAAIAAIMYFKLY